MSYLLKARYAALVFATFSLVGFYTINGFAQDSGTKVIATINGLEITERELALAQSDLQQQFAQVPAEQRRAAILNALIDINEKVDTGFRRSVDTTQPFAQERSRFVTNEIRCQVPF